ncbi:hypothetical protein [Parvularcula lutaonensis]|uniref:Uncharacterized protein n=1 Tax=Parvularcula lutaonensis TaxID=491923 RepID=A0ABV7MBS7_9PROT|nr:hypothetical protein [Parvularcula lutaonensis]
MTDAERVYAHQAASMLADCENALTALREAVTALHAEIDTNDPNRITLGKARYYAKTLGVSAELLGRFDPAKVR